MIKDLSVETQIAFAIRLLCCRYYNVSILNIVSDSRKKVFVKARHTAMFLIYKYCSLSLTEIGVMFGNKDHTTVIYARQMAENSLDTKKYLYEGLMTLDKEIEVMAERYRQEAQWQSSKPITTP